MSVEFIDQLEDGAGAEMVHLPHELLTTQAQRRLISEGFADIYSASSL